MYTLSGMLYGVINRTVTVYMYVCIELVSMVIVRIVQHGPKFIPSVQLHMIHLNH